MRKVRILTPHSLGGGKDVYPGDEVELNDSLAAVKVARGWAEYVEIQDREPAVANREPRRRRATNDSRAAEADPEEENER